MISFCKRCIVHICANPSIFKIEKRCLQLILYLFERGIPRLITKNENNFFPVTQFIDRRDRISFKGKRQIVEYLDGYGQKWANMSWSILSFNNLTESCHWTCLAQDRSCTSGIRPWIIKWRCHEIDELSWRFMSRAFCYSLFQKYKESFIIFHPKLLNSVQFNLFLLLIFPIRYGFDFFFKILVPST